MLLPCHRRSDIQSYHLGGMGCSNGVVGINLVRDLLKVGRTLTAGSYQARPTP